MADIEQESAQQVNEQVGASVEEQQPPQTRYEGRADRRGPQYARMCLKCGQMTHTTRQCAFYKTHWCKHEQRPGGCRLKWKCKYVHDMSEMRPTTQEWCVKFVFENGEGRFYGCGSFQHPYSGCPQLAACGRGEDTSYQRLPLADFAALVLKSQVE